MIPRNLLLRDKTRADIDKLVDRILRDLGKPEPPLQLADVRDLLKLHIEYYSSAEDSLVGEVVHKIVMAGKQVWQRPGLLWEAIKKCDLRALYLYDSKRILISQELPKIKQRWGEGHEIGHSIIPWHESLCHGDHERTLSLGCHEQVEAEANYAAGQLLFLRSRFEEELLSSDVNIKNVKRLASRFGNTITSALWRSVESLLVPAFGLVSVHPVRLQLEAVPPVQHFIRSPRFSTEFPDITAEALFRALQQFCSPGRGMLGAADVLVLDSNGVQHVFAVECFFNTYTALTLGAWKRPRTVAVAV